MLARLSEHFTLKELCVSEWAARSNVPNVPPEVHLSSLQELAHKLEEVRAVLKEEMHINSGYRSPKVNKAIGGSPTSDHQYCLAADFISPAFGSPEQICYAIMESGIKFDQLILEYPDPEGGGWVHLGIGKRMRQQVLTKNHQGMFTGLRA